MNNGTGTPHVQSMTFNTKERTMKHLLLITLLLSLSACRPTTPDTPDLSCPDTCADQGTTADAGPDLSQDLAACQKHVSEVEEALIDKTDTLNGCLTSFPKLERFEITGTEAPLPCDDAIQIDIHKQDGNALYVGYRLGEERRFTGRLDMANHPDRRVFYVQDMDVMVRIESCNEDRCKASCVNLANVE